MRTVHGLEKVTLNLSRAQAVEEIGAATALLSKLLKRVPLRNRRILTLLIVGKVPTGAVEIELADVGSKDL
jgi:hypothetical protein